MDEGGGQLVDLGPHLVDQAVQLLGPVDSVYAEVRSVRGGADDLAFLALRHASGAVTHVSLGAVIAAPGPRLRALGTAGAFVTDHLDGQEDALREGRRPGEPGWGVVPMERWGRLVHGDRAEPTPSERGQWDAFYPAVRDAIVGGGADAGRPRRRGGGAARPRRRPGVGRDRGGGQAVSGPTGNRVSTASPATRSIR